MMKNLGVLIFESFFLGLTFLIEARRNISHNISFFLIIIDIKVELRECLGLADLIKTQTFCINKLIEVIMISKDKELIFIAF